MARVQDDIWYRKLNGSSTISGGMLGQYSRGIQIEQAEVDLDVAVGGLNAAERENAFAQRGARRGSSTGNAGQFQREVGLDGGADFGGAVE